MNCFRNVFSPLVSFSVASLVSLGLSAAPLQAQNCLNPIQTSGPIQFPITTGGVYATQWTAPWPGDWSFSLSSGIFGMGLLNIDVYQGVGCSATLIHSWAGFTGNPIHEMLSVTQPGETFYIEFVATGQANGSIGYGCTGNLGAFEPNNHCMQAANIGNGLLQAVVNPQNVDYYQFWVDPGATAVVDFPNGNNLNHYLILQLIAENDPALCSGMGSPNPLAEDSPLIWTNGTNQVQKVYLFVAIDGQAPPCAPYQPTVSGVRERIMSFCDPMDPHSGGISAELTGSFGGAGGSGLHLESQSGPVGQMGYFLVGTGAAEPGIPVGNGRLCLSIGSTDAVYRYNVGSGALQSLGAFDGSGVFQNLSGTSTVGTGFDVPSLLPNSAGAVVSGQTWNFQMWFRDSSGGVGITGFTNGLAVTF